MTDQPQQRPMSAAQRTLFAALDGVVEDAVSKVIGQKQMAHLRWHQEMKQEPSADCHTCVLLEMVQSEKVEDDGEPVLSAVGSEPTG